MVIDKANSKIISLIRETNSRLEDKDLKMREKNKMN